MDQMEVEWRRPAAQKEEKTVLFINENYKVIANLMKLIP